MAVRSLVQGNSDLSGFLDKGSLIVVVSFLQHQFLEELERTVALLAFEDSANSPVSDLLDISQRQKTASELNAAILTSQSHEKGRQSVTTPIDCCLNAAQVSGFLKRPSTCVDLVVSSFQFFPICQLTY
jgi:hypothetical protein